MDKYKKIMDMYLNNDDIARNNANMMRSIAALEGVVVGELMKDYLFDVITDNIPIRHIHEEGWAYLHQTFRISPYSYHRSNHIKIKYKDKTFFVTFEELFNTLIEAFNSDDHFRVLLFKINKSAVNKELLDLFIENRNEDNDIDIYVNDINIDYQINQAVVGDYSVLFLDLSRLGIEIYDRGKYVKLNGLTRKVSKKPIVLVSTKSIGGLLAVTDDHPMIDGEDKNNTYKPKLLFKEKMSKIQKVDLSFIKDYVENIYGLIFDENTTSNSIELPVDLIQIITKIAIECPVSNINKNEVLIYVKNKLLLNTIVDIFDKYNVCHILRDNKIVLKIKDLEQILRLDIFIKYGLNKLSLKNYIEELKGNVIFKDSTSVQKIKLNDFIKVRILKIIEEEINSIIENKNYKYNPSIDIQELIDVLIEIKQIIAAERLVTEHFDTESEIIESSDFAIAAFDEELAIVLGELEDYVYDIATETETFNSNGYYVHNCIGLSAKDVAMFGLQSNAKNAFKAKPPKRLDTLFTQAANLICLIAQEVSGATSLNDISTIAASYLYVQEKEFGIKYSEYMIKNLWQSFLYNINLPFRGSNSPFSNITLEFGKPNPHLANEYVVFAGEVKPYKYSDIPSEYYDRIVDGFIEAMYEGDGNGNVFTFPLITINLYDDFDWNNKMFHKLLKYSEYFGGMYFQNYMTEPFTKESVYKKMNPYIEPFDIGMIYSNCCRMTFNVEDVLKYTGSNPFHSNSGVGGIGVYNINMNRILYLAGTNFEDFKKIFDYIYNVGVQTLRIKRAFIKKHWEDLYPYFSYYQKTDKSLFNIFSVVGTHEGLINAGIKDGLKSDEGKEYAIKLAKYIRDKIEKSIEEHGELFNLEYAPSENAACKLAEKDILFARRVVRYLKGQHIYLSKDSKLDNIAKELARKNLYVEDKA